MSTPKPRTRRPTSHDVAKLAGVSQPTVSLVMAGRGDKVGISKATQERVLAVARELSYVPNRLMRSIQRGRSNIIGVYGANQKWSVRHSYWSEVMAGLHEATNERNHELLFFNDSSKTVDETLGRILGGLVDGLVIQAAVTDEVTRRLVGSGLPIVAIGDIYPGVPFVAVENFESIKQMVRHLYDRGHRHIAYARVLDPETTKAHSHLADEIRPKGFHEAVRELGLDPVTCPALYVERCPVGFIQRLLSMDPRPTAVLCHNDEWAYPILAAAEEAGLQVPGELAITGFDATPPPFARKLVTTHISPIPEMSALAVSRLIALIEGHEVTTQTLIPPTFKQGETT